FVLITGASKGIGAACVRQLAAAGHRIFAGVRRRADAEPLVADLGDRVIPVLLEVTSPEQIETAARQVEQTVGDQGLHGLVNNAGIAVAGPLEFLPIDELRRQLEINVIGQIAVTQALMPALRKATGRIVFMGSISGRSALPITGAYAASKFALEALSDALRVELLPWGIRVVIIEPGVVVTPIWETSLAAGLALFDRMPARLQEYYGTVIDAVRRRARSGASRGMPAEHVAEVVETALFANRPRPRYLVGRDAHARALFEKLPDRWRDRIIARRLARL
ncbi:MAG TPA: SDR family oxidoreductase, partial [Longimicrobiales bacterium]|nr:SDR family oxidoreductase [Longimicrobiales bacterium]